MRRFYSLCATAVGLMALLAAGFALFAWQASAAPPTSIPAGGPTASATPLTCSYSVVTATGTIVPGTTDTGNHCDDCVTDVFFPFPVTYYGQEFSQALVSSNGNLQFVSANQISFNECLPGPNFEYTLMPHWDDLLTDANPGCAGGGCGVFSNVMGTAPNRIFTLEWRAVLYSDPFERVNFQIWFYEGQSKFDYVYGEVSNNGSDSTVGVQKDGTTFTQYSCLTNSLSPGLVLRWNAENCPVASPTSTATPCPSCTATMTPVITQTPTTIPSPTATPCGMERFTGSITSNDPQQAGRIIRDETRSVCELPKAYPGTEDTALRHYDMYTRTNDTGSARCVTVGISTLCNGTQFIFAAAYLNSFNPNNLAENYLADMGVSPYPHAYMSFELDPGESVVIVVSEVTTNEGCGEYTLTITGLGSCNTFTPTPTGTPPTATQTATPTPIGPSCGYDFVTATATIVPGAEDIGNHCDDCVTEITLPFPFQLYGQEYSTANVSSNGNIQFATASTSRFNTCLPGAPLSASLLPNWTDLVTDCSDCGIYTSTSGIAPNRIFNIEWRAGYFKGASANFEARLYEGTGVFDFVYGQMGDPGNNSTVGVQNIGASSFSQYSCNSGGLSNGLLVRGSRQVCSTATPVLTPTSVSTSTPPTGTHTPVDTQTVAPTPTVCNIMFADVPPDSTFYPFVRCLACAGIINGYPCGDPNEPCNGNNDPYFRPGNNITRAQIAKIVSNSAGFQEPVSGQSFQDVYPGSPFYEFVERLASRQIISGYACGGLAEPCGVGNLPFFRSNNRASRGQLAKIVCRAFECSGTPVGQTFEDAPPDSTFYVEIEQLHTLGALNGYPCGGDGEPCGPGNRPYVRPGANVTRGQTSKIVAEVFFPQCNPSDRLRKH